jgi:two-component system sensor histidine kinase BaeS
MAHPDRPRRRHSLFVRLLAGSVLVAVCAIAATAWLAARSATGTLREQQGESASTDAKIYDDLLGYAATHPRWTDVGDTVRDLADETGRRIALTTEQGVALADSAPAQQLPDRAYSVIDPLEVDPSQVAMQPIDERAVGPFRLTAAERTRSRQSAEALAECLRGNGAVVAVLVSPTGRARVDGYDGTKAQPCASTVTAESATETRALRELTPLVADCMRRNHELGTSRLVVDDTGTPQLSGAASPGAIACLDEGRRKQLRSYVAPTALIFVASDAQTSGTGIRLATVGTGRLALVALLVLLPAIAVSAALAARQVRPVHALTDAAQRMRDGDRSARVPVLVGGELGALSTAFNDMSAHLERVERQRRDLVSDVAHELRTPMANIRGWLEATQDGVAELDEDLVRLLLEESLSLQHLVDDLQDLAVADAGQLRLHREPLDVGDLLESALAPHRVAAGAAGVTLSLEPTTVADIEADGMRLRQALGNLISNALRHTPYGGRVTVRAREADGQVLIDVADTGAGISEENLPHVFDRFWRADRSRSRHTGGTGLGLAIVQRFAEAHGGQVTVTSVLGAGSTFTLRLPATPASPSP